MRCVALLCCVACGIKKVARKITGSCCSVYCFCLMSYRAPATTTRTHTLASYSPFPFHKRCAALVPFLLSRFFLLLAERRRTKVRPRSKHGICLLRTNTLVHTGLHVHASAGGKAHGTRCYGHARAQRCAAQRLLSPKAAAPADQMPRRRAKALFSHLRQQRQVFPR